MRINIIYLALLILCNSCSSNTQSDLSQDSTEVHVKEKNISESIPIGDSLISSKQFMDKIRGIDLNPLKELTYDYKRTTEWKCAYGNMRLEMTTEYLLPQNHVDGTELTEYYRTLDRKCTLITQLNGEKKDSIVVYKEINYLYGTLIEFFYLDEHLTLWKAGIFSDEEGTSLTFWNRYAIDSLTGSIALEEKMMEQVVYEEKIQDWKVIMDDYTEENEEVIADFLLDFNSDGIEDRIIIYDYQGTGVFDCIENPRDGDRAFFLFKGISGDEEYRLDLFSRAILPTVCSHGLADPILDVKYDGKFFSFSSLSLRSGTMYKSTYYFDNELNLSKIILESSNIGGNSNNKKRVLLSDEFKKTNLQDFIMEDFQGKFPI